MYVCIYIYIYIYAIYLCKRVRGKANTRKALPLRDEAQRKETRSYVNGSTSPLSKERL